MIRFSSVDDVCLISYYIVIVIVIILLFLLHWTK